MHIGPGTPTPAPRGRFGFKNNARRLFVLAALTGFALNCQSSGAPAGTGATGGSPSGGTAGQAPGGASGKGGTGGNAGASGQGGGNTAGAGQAGNAGATGGGGESGRGGNTGGAAGAAGAAGRAGADAGAPDAAGGSGAKVTAAPAMADSAHVRLLPGSPFYDRQELHRKGFLGTQDTDKLLYLFRSVAKLPQAGGATGPYKGWDGDWLRGHMLGHYLSAASRMAAATADDTLKTKVNYVVTELAKCQTALGNSGYLSAFPATVFDALEGKGGDSGGIVVPYYTIHKIMAGLLDAHHYVGNKQALDVVTKMADYFRGRLTALPAATIEKMFRTDAKNPSNEFGAMSDVLSELSGVTGEQKYLETAKIFNRSWFITPLATGQDKLEGIHSNTHIAQALGIARTANISGDADSLKASEAFWKLSTGPHAFVMGGNGFHEWFDKANVEAGPNIDSQTGLPPTTAETCSTHNMLKLTSRLIERSPRIEYADYYERAVYNHILATIAPDSGAVTYFTPMHGHFRTYLDGTFCCSGSGLENTPRFNEGIYFTHDDSIWVNLYIPSELTWDATGLTIRQEGHAAAGETVKLTIAKGGTETQATINLRIPSWVSGAAALTINGTAQNQSLKPGSYVALTRAWKVGDVVTLTLPMTLRLEQAKDVTSMVSMFYGPNLLAGELGNANMPNDVGDKDAHLGVAAANVPTITNASTNPADWLTPIAGTPLAFKAQNAGAATGITFRPLYQVHHQRYSVYWTLKSN